MGQEGDKNASYHPYHNPSYQVFLRHVSSRVPACLAGVEVGCVRLCRVAGNTV